MKNGNKQRTSKPERRIPRWHNGGSNHHWNSVSRIGIVPVHITVSVDEMKLILMRVAKQMPGDYILKLPKKMKREDRKNNSPATTSERTVYDKTETTNLGECVR